MAPSAVAQTPSLSTFLRSLKQNDIGTSIEFLISLLRRRQIRNSRQCAIATAQLLLRVLSAERSRDVPTLIKRIRDVGSRLVAAQPREPAVGNVVRRILGVVREVAEEDPNNPGSASGLGDHNGMPALSTNSNSSLGQAPQSTSLFGLLQHPSAQAVIAPTQLNQATASKQNKKGQDGAAREKVDIKAEVIDGIKELLDELEVVDSQIAESALEHIHDGEIILTHTSSQTIQKFLTTAAKKRKFTVVHAEAYPNDHTATHATILNGGKKGAGDDDEADERWKPLTSMGIKVILVPDTAAFALMSRINKVILAPHAVLANGSLIAAASASTIALAAKEHRVPVVVLSGVYKLSPIYPTDLDEMIEYGDPGKVVPYADGEFMELADVVNPVFDWVRPDLVDLYITNIGAHAPNALYRIVEDHYSPEDVDLGTPMP